MINTKKIFDKTIQEIAEVVKLINEDGEDVDSKIISDMNDDISDLHATLFDGNNDFVELKDLKNYIKDVVGKDYFSDKRCWEYLYDSVFEVFMDIPNEFDESMQTGLGMAQQLPTNSIYDDGIFDIYNDDEEEKKEMNKRLEEKKISSEDKKQALADYLKVDAEEIEDGYDDNHFEVDGDEYMVLTEDESYEEFKDWEMSLIDDLGLESFSENFQEHILENCINDSWFEQVAEEEADYYIGEMDDEELLDYAHDHKIAKNIDDVDSEEFEDERTSIEEDCLDTYREEILDQGISEYFENIYGRGWAKEMKDTLEKEIDWEKVIEDLYDWDSREVLWGSMASYDGNVIELDKVNGEWLFAYRTN